MRRGSPLTYAPAKELNDLKPTRNNPIGKPISYSEPSPISSLTRENKTFTPTIRGWELKATAADIIINLRPKCKSSYKHYRSIEGV
jgi:hypothetical protein